MLRTRIAGAVGALALLAAPAVAVAHGDGHHHQRHHHAKKAHPRDVTGTAIATVQSFADGELTLALPSGKTYSADVTDRTVIICRAATPSAKASRHDGDRGRCGTDKLVAGAQVSWAKLALKGDTVTWKKVVVVS
jgi:hypothetical protein